MQSNRNCMIFSFLGRYAAWIGSYRRFGRTLKNEPTGWPANKLTNCQPTLRNILELRRSHSHLGKSQKSRKRQCCWHITVQAYTVMGRITTFRSTTDRIDEGGPITIQGYYKINRHFQRYVVSKPLAQWTHNWRSSVEDRVFVPPLPVSLNEPKQRITTAVASVDEDMLRSV